MTLLVQKNSNGRVKHIILTLSGDTLHRQWGVLGGKLQETSNTYDSINPGKANELTPQEAALADHDRIVARKIKEGYTKAESLDLDEAEIQHEAMDLNDIPTQFCCSKPTATITDAALDKLIQSGNAWFQTKRNGLCHYILTDMAGEVKIYTRRMDDHTVKYPHIVQEVKAKSRIYLPGTLFITEFVVDPAYGLPHMEAFTLMSSISKSNVSGGKPKADLAKNFARQAIHKVRALVFGVMYYNGIKKWHMSYQAQLDLLGDTIPKEPVGQLLFRPDALFFNSAAEVREYVRSNKAMIEGLVVWDLTEAMEVTMNGKPKRRAAWKLKAKDEMDVIAFSYNEGSGDLQGKIGSLNIGKYYASGKVFSMGSVGSGLKPLEGDCDIDSWVFPCVVHVEYDQQFPTGALQFPVYVCKHADKTIEDVDLAVAA